jgi:hypothetical protein
MVRLSHEEKADPVAAEAGLGGISELPTRVNRYGVAKKNALNVADYMAFGYVGNLPPTSEDKAVEKAERGLRQCGNYLNFRHYIESDQVKLHKANLCRRHLLCQLCAIRRGVRTLQAYVERWQQIQADWKGIKLFLVTLTVKDGPDLLERVNHLYKGHKELWKRTHRHRGPTALRTIAGAVWSYEIKRGKNSGEWHPHLHMIAATFGTIDKYRLAEEWKEITGDSYIVDVRPIRGQIPADLPLAAKTLMQDWYQEELIGAFCEVFKYAVKFSDQPPQDTVHAWRTLAGRRLIGSAGMFRGIPEASELTDGVLDENYVEYFFRYVGGEYKLDNRPLDSRARNGRLSERMERLRQIHGDDYDDDGDA